MAIKEKITEQERWLSDEEREYFEQAFTDLDPHTMPEAKEQNLESTADELERKFFEYKKMWQWWGSLFIDEDVPRIESYMKEIGEAVGLRLLEKHKTVAERAREYIAATDGWFELHMLYRELQIATDADACKAAKMAVLREYKKGNIEKHGKKNATYRKPDYDCEEIDILNAGDKPVTLYLPLDLHEHVALYPGDVCVVAGKWNAGKSAFLLECARLNMKEHDTWYFTSEMKGPRFKKRVQLMEGVTLDEFAENVTIRGREGGFHDVIQPNSLNLIDYLQINEDFYRVGAQIREIAEKLQQGLAIVALQKDAAATYGYGGQKGLQRPTLYLTIDDGVVKIVKAKDWVTSSNPNGKIQKFKLYKGVNFQAEGVLHYAEDDPHDSKRRYG